MVFDMDGVVINSHRAHRAAWKSFLEGMGRRTSDAELDIILDGGKREEILKYFLGELDPKEIAEYGKRKDELLRNHGSKLEPMIGVIEFLDYLLNSGVRMAIATSASAHRALRTLEELGLTHYFEAIITGDEVALGKPDPAIYRLAAARMQEAPDHLLAVEDAVSGVKAARSAGMRCLGVAHNGRADLLRSAGANPIIEDFRSLSLAQLEACFH
jgi:HAD superfamily hydrolase (TIGR01509 family)